MLTCLVLVGQGSPTDRWIALKGGLGLIPDDPSRIAPYDLRQSYMSLSWPWVRLLRVLAVSSFARRLHAAAHQSNPAPGVGAGWGLLGYLGELQNRAAVFLSESVARIPITRRHVDTGVAGDLDAVLFHRLSLSTSV